jgi:hypothetical protein
MFVFVGYVTSRKVLLIFTATVCNPLAYLQKETNAYHYTATGGRRELLHKYMMPNRKPVSEN